MQHDGCTQGPSKQSRISEEPHGRRARVHPSGVTYDRLWERLIEYLNEWSRAREVPGGIEVTVEQLTGATRTIQIVLTPEGWDDYASTIYGGGDPSATAIQGSVLAMPDDRPFLVYDTYDWVPSTTPTLPVDTFRPEPGGEWVAFDRDGNVTSRFADWVEPE